MSFNGAAAMKPRKTRSLTDCRRRKGPLQWGRGDEAAEDNLKSLGKGDDDVLQWGRGDEAAEDSSSATSITARCLSFNGAAAMKPRKTRCHYFGDMPHALLQWGRGDEAAEDQGKEGEAGLRQEASMGPRR